MKVSIFPVSLTFSSFNLKTKENGDIQKQVKHNLEREVVQSVMSILLSSDRNQDFLLSGKELTRLQVKLGSIPGIRFDKENFQKITGDKKELHTKEIMRMFRNLKADIPEEDNIFHLEPRQLTASKRGYFFSYST